MTMLLSASESGEGVSPLIPTSSNGKLEIRRYIPNARFQWWTNWNADCPVGKRGAIGASMRKSTINRGASFAESESSAVYSRD